MDTLNECNSNCAWVFKLGIRQNASDSRGIKGDAASRHVDSSSLRIDHQTINLTVPDPTNFGQNSYQDGSPIDEASWRSFSDLSNFSANEEINEEIEKLQPWLWYTLDPSSHNVAMNESRCFLSLF